MYPNWIYYPNQSTPPAWVSSFLNAISDTAGTNEDDWFMNSKGSNGILRQLSEPLEELGFPTESKSGVSGRIRRPVLFGEQGEPRITYEVDAFHPEYRIIVEIEAGRAWMGNAVYRDLVRTSLITDANFLILGVMQQYRYKSKGRDVISRDYDQAKSLLDAVFASGRIRLPFKGILLFGY